MFELLHAKGESSLQKYKRKSAIARCFKELRMDSLPVVYCAWMTFELVKEQLKDWDRESQRQSRKVLLLLDNCAAHPRVDF